MKRLLFAFLLLTCLMALFCPTFAVVECKMPEELPGTKEGLAVHDVLVIGGTPEENTTPDAPAQDAPAGGSPFGPDADDQYATMGDLYQAWGGYVGYPDYVCGVWSTDGGMTSLTVAVTDDQAGEKGREEILSLLKDPDTVTFTTHKYSYKELLAVNDTIVERMIAGGSPINSCGIHEMENKVCITVLETAENAEAIAEELTATYGDKVFVEVGNMIFDETTAEKSRDRGSGVLLLLVVMGLPVMAAALKLPARVTNTGRVVTEERPTRAQVEAALTEHTETPPDRVEQELNRKL